MSLSTTVEIILKLQPDSGLKVPRYLQQQKLFLSFSQQQEAAEVESTTVEIILKLQPIG